MKASLPLQGARLKPKDLGAGAKQQPHSSQKKA
jgi:hypothetical protein